jgi:aldehyde:ferredoxin oxidoreductase
MYGYAGEILRIDLGTKEILKEPLLEKMCLEFIGGRGYADSNMGGHFGPTLKYAGYDMAVITGKAKTPSYLFIEDGTIEIRSAKDYWGKRDQGFWTQIRLSTTPIL